MPKTEIDYSNTIFYKISCKSEDNDELYIGHTTNFVQRKSAHKNSCKNPKSSSYPLKLYKTIRDCGGWDNWNMEIIAFRNCNDSREARKTEQEYYEKLGATLNSIQPLPPPKNLILAEPRNIQTNDNTIIDCHGAFKYKCDKCYYFTNKKGDFKKHLLSTKHIKMSKCDDISTKLHKCNCGKIFSYRQGLSRHKRECEEANSSQYIPDNMSLDNPTILIELLKQNHQEFKDIMLEERREFQKIITDQHEKLMEVCKTLSVT